MAFDEKPAAPVRQAKDFKGAPSHCRCGSRAVIALATVLNRNTGRLSTGAASEFCGRDNNNNPNGLLQDWYELREFRGYCADCYEGFKQPGPRKYTDKQVRYAWQWLLGEVSSRSPTLGPQFKRISLTDEQRDRAIEIVNYEAHRTHQPDSIPQEFRIAEVWA